MSRLLTEKVLRATDVDVDSPRGMDPERATLWFRRRLRASQERERMLWAAFNEWGWHLTDCPREDGSIGPACDCGFDQVQDWVHPSTKARLKQSMMILARVRSLWHAMNASRGGSGKRLARIHAEHDQLVAWLAEAGRPLDAEMRQTLTAIGARAEATWLARGTAPPPPVLDGHLAFTQDIGSSTLPGGKR